MLMPSVAVYSLCKAGCKAVKRYEGNFVLRFREAKLVRCIHTVAYKNAIFVLLVPYGKKKPKHLYYARV